MVRQTAKVLFFEILGGLLFLAVAAAALVAVRLAQGPVELGVFKHEIEQALSEIRDGREVRLDRASLEWSPEARRLWVTASGLEFRDSKGQLAGEADQAFITFDASALFLGDLEIVALTLDGGFMRVDQLSPSVWSVAGEPLPPIPAGDFPDTPAEWLDTLNRILTSMIAEGQIAVPEMRLEDVSFRNLALDLTLEDGTQLMRMVSAEGQLSRTAGDLRLRVSGQGVGPGLPRGLAVDLRTSGGFDTLVGEMAFADWSISELATRIGIRDDRVTGLPADMAFRFEARRSRGLTGVSAEAVAGGGAVRVAETAVPVSRFEGQVDYDPLTDTAAVRFDSLDAGVVRGRLRLQVDQAVYGGRVQTGGAEPGVRPSSPTSAEEATGERTFALTSPQLDIDARPVFPELWTFEDLSLEGRASLDGHRLWLDQARLKTGPAVVRASGRLARVLDRGPSDLPFELDVVAEVDGPAGTRDVLRFWPIGLGEGARRFARDKIEAGTLTQARARIDVDADSFRKGYLADDAIAVDFSARDVRVRFMHDLPPVDAAAGSARLTGNALTVDLDRGRFGDWDLTDGQVDFPRFNPKGARFDVMAEGTGPVESLVADIFDSRLNLRDRTGFDPARLSGRGEVRFEMSRPALSRVPIEEVTLSATGVVRDGGLANAAAGIDLTETRADVSLDKSGIEISGLGRFGPADLTFDWREGFDDGDSLSKLNLQTTVTPDIVNRFGLLGRPYLTGEIPLEAQLDLDGGDVRRAHVEADLTPARIDLVEVGWLKPPGRSADAVIDYDFTGEVRLASGRLTSETAMLAGSLRLGEDGRLIEADLNRAYLQDRADVSGEMFRNPDGGLSLSLGGPFLDISNAVPDLGAMGAAGSLRSALTVDAEVETLRIGEGLDLSGARFAAISTADGLQSLSASGVLPDGSDMTTSYETDEAGGRLSLKSGNAGYLLDALFGADFLDGGVVTVEGDIRADGAPSILDVRVRDAQMRNAPVLTQILSIASLQGLADTLGGDGVRFTEIVAPIRVAGGRYVIDGGRASGPALGLTANGWVEPESGGLDLSGVLVPSFGVNSALGGIPIIGDLVVGRAGEGVFSLTYSVRGSLDKAQVSVNPLSAVTPGVLRRIFENPASTRLPDREAQ